MKHFIFVYGSLKKGESNHGLMQGQRFLANVQTLPQYRLYALDHYPAMIEDAVGGRSIEGELWEVEEARMPALDRLEGVSQGLYRRALIPLLPPHDHLKVEGYLYLRSLAGREECGSAWPA